MDKDVMIHITGLHFAQEQEGASPVEMVTPGEYYKKNDSHFLIYEDLTDESETAGKSVLKFKDGSLEVMKRGESYTNLIFEEGKRTMNQYNTPFGALNIGLSTLSVKVKEQESTLELRAKYGLSLGEDFAADCTVYIKAENKDDASVI